MEKSSFFITGQKYRKLGCLGPGIYEREIGRISAYFK